MQIEALLEEPEATGMYDRRRAERLIGAWARAARGFYPSWEKMQQTDLGDDWRWAFAVDVEQSIGFPYFIYLGKGLAKLSDLYLAGSEEWAMSILDHVASVLGEAVAQNEPVMIEDELLLPNNRILSFRCVTTPLADDGENTSHLMGVVSGRLKTG